jgi:hypothetical protein
MQGARYVVWDALVRRLALDLAIARHAWKRDSALPFRHEVDKEVPARSEHRSLCGSGVHRLLIGLQVFDGRRPARKQLERAAQMGPVRLDRSGAVALRIEPDRHVVIDKLKRREKRGGYWRHLHDFLRVR